MSTIDDLRAAQRRRRNLAATATSRLLQAHDCAARVRTSTAGRTSSSDSTAALDEHALRYFSRDAQLAALRRLEYQFFDTQVETAVEGVEWFGDLGHREGHVQ